MASQTMYVAPAPLGNDANNGTSALTPKEHVQEAFAASTNGNDVTISCADGAYTSTATYTTLSKPVATLSIISENDYGATITASGTAQARVIHLTSTTGPTSFGKVIIDAQDNQSGCVTATNPDITFDGTQLLNSTDIFVSGSGCTNLTMTNGWLVSMSAASKRIFAFTNDLVAAGTYLIESGTVSLNSPAINNRLFQVDLTVDGQTVTFQDNTISGIIGSATASDSLLWTRGVETVNILRNSMTITSGAGGNFDGFHVGTDATFLTDSVTINDNYLDFGTNQADLGAYGIKVGEESITDANRINGVSVNRNTVIGANHSYMFGHITDAKGQGNLAKSGIIGFLAKGTNTCEWAGGLSIDMSGKHFHSKGDVGSTFANNTGIGATIAPTEGFLFTEENVLVLSSGTNFINNLAYSAVTVAKFSDCYATNTSNYENNCFYSSVAEPATPYSYVGTDYATMALWQSAVDLTAATAANNLTADPLFTDYANADYTLSALSPCISAGTHWWTGPNPIGYGAEPFPDIDIPIGGIVDIHSPFLPRNL